MDGEKNASAVEERAEAPPVPVREHAARVARPRVLAAAVSRRRRVRSVTQGSPRSRVRGPVERDGFEVRATSSWRSKPHDLVVIW
jgi:hypothetical protein